VNEILVPEWIKREMAERESSELHAEADAQRQRADLLVVKSEGPEFWRQLLRELALTTESLGRIGMQGKLSKITSTDFEDAYRLSVSLSGVTPKQTYSDIRYQKGSTAIQCYPQDGNPCQLQLCVGPKDSVGIVPDEPGLPLTPEKTAESIVRQMAGIVRSRHS
jgi:hypothetical protein